VIVRGVGGAGPVLTGGGVAHEVMGRLFVTLAARTLMGSADGAAWPSPYAATHPDAANGGFIGPAGRDQTSGTPGRRPCPRAPTALTWAPGCGVRANG
jgi:hypothetical protein